MPALRKILDNAVEAVAGTLVVVISLAVLTSVLYRYVLMRSATWADELPSFLFIWVVFLGAALGVKRSAHFEISAFVGNLPPIWRSRLKYVTMLSEAIMALFLVVYGWRLVGLTIENRSPGLDIPMGYVYGSVPISGILMFLYLIPQFVTHLRSGNASEAESSGGGA